MQASVEFSGEGGSARGVDVKAVEHELLGDGLGHVKDERVGAAEADGVEECRAGVGGEAAAQLGALGHEQEDEPLALAAEVGQDFEEDLEGRRVGGIVARVAEVELFERLKLVGEGLAFDDVVPGDEFEVVEGPGVGVGSVADGGAVGPAGAEESEVESSEGASGFLADPVALLADPGGGEEALCEGKVAGGREAFERLEGVNAEDDGVEGEWRALQEVWQGACVGEAAARVAEEDPARSARVEFVEERALQAHAHGGGA